MNATCILVAIPFDRNYFIGMKESDAKELIEEYLFQDGDNKYLGTIAYTIEKSMCIRVDDLLMNDVLAGANMLEMLAAFHEKGVDLDFDLFGVYVFS